MTLYPDRDPVAADWAKLGAWDLQIDTPGQLYAWLDQKGMTVDEFKALPVYSLNQARIPWLKTIEQPEIGAPVG
jgi:hypothetical protein